MHTLPALRALIHRIRLASVQNPHRGLAIWFEAFDTALVHGEWSSCRGLLNEIRQGGYRLAEREWTFVTGREAALFFCQGIQFHLAHEDEKAQRCYQDSLRLYESLDDDNGKGQVALALDELHSGERHTQDLAHLVGRLRVPGNGSTLLGERGKACSVAEQLQVLLAAREQGSLQPVQAAIAASTPEIAAAAAASLAWFEPGPDEATLLALLASANWMVRWQAVLILQRRVQQEKSGVVAYQKDVRLALTRCLAQGEMDPMVRRDIAYLLQMIGRAEDVSYLAALVDDSDPDVRVCALEAIGKIQDGRARAVLPANVRAGQDYRGRRVTSALSGAMQNTATAASASGPNRAASVRPAWLWAGLLYVLPLLMMLVTYPYRLTTLPSFFKLFYDSLPGGVFDGLLVLGLFWGWRTANRCTLQPWLMRMNPQEDLLTVSVGTLWTAGVIVSGVSGRPPLALPALLLIAAALGLEIGIVGGLLSRTTYSTFKYLLIILVQTGSFIIPTLVALWIFHGLGGIGGLVLAVLSWIVTVVVYVFCLGAGVELISYPARMLARTGPFALTILCILGSLIGLWFYLKISIFLGSACILAIACCAFVNKHMATTASAGWRAGIAIALVCVSAFLVWVVFLGGWGVLAG
jgi:hypothetical protein